MSWKLGSTLLIDGIENCLQFFSFSTLFVNSNNRSSIETTTIMLATNDCFYLHFNTVYLFNISIVKTSFLLRRLLTIFL